MKKIIFLVVITFLLTGCGGTNKDIIKEFKKNIESTKSYKMMGSMEIYNDEDTFKYAVNVSYLKPNYYKVSMTNQSNDHEQIILRNDDVVYGITPSLNKSFKFQSEWPNNGSQPFLLQSLLNDVNNDIKNVEAKKDNNGYIIKTKVNYPNNSDMKMAEIYLDKKYNVSKVLVLNNDGLTKIKVIYKDIDYKANLDKEEFALEKYIDKDCCGVSESGKLDDIIYPLYIPTNTYLTSKETIDTASGNRNILTFTGDKNFVLIEETASVSKEMEIIPVYGDPEFINDTIGALQSTSLTWTMNNVDYYLTSKDLSGEDLVNIASSVGNTIIVGK